MVFSKKKMEKLANPTFTGASGNAGGRVACCQISEPKSLITEDDKENGASLDELVLGLIFGQAIVH